MLLLMAMVDFYHTMSFKGMPDFLIPCTTANRATTFWIIGRLIGGVGLLTAGMIPADTKLRVHKSVFFIAPVLISLVILNLVTYCPGLIAPMYIEGQGLTALKITLEYIVILMMLIACFFLIREYGRNNDRFVMILSCAMIVGFFSELSFTLYVDVYGIYNYLGHLLKFIMYFIIFRVVFIRNIRQPYLELSVAKDELKNYADNLDRIVEQRTVQIRQIHQKLLEDLEYARDIQLAMLPKKLPNSAHADFEACYFPADRASGDFYNIFKIDEAKIGMYIGDVSGHGVSAAMLTVYLNQSIMVAMENAQGIKEILPPSRVLKRLYLNFNQSEFKREVYIVMMYGILDLNTREFTFASAGLNVSPLVVSASGEAAELDIKGFPICKFTDNYDVEYSDRKIGLMPGDKILFFTDGLVEAENPDQKVYSDDKLKEKLRLNRHRNAQQLIQSLKEDVLSFVERTKLEDDITFFVMEIK